MEPNIFYATVNHKCYNILRVGIVRLGRLSLSQEEADTRMFLLVKRSLQYFQENFIISSPDAHVFLLLLMISENIFVKIPFKTGNKKARIVNINKVKQSWNLSYTSVVDVRLERFTKALLSLDTFTGCDTVCAFAEFMKDKSDKEYIMCEVF